MRSRAAGEGTIVCKNLREASALKAVVLLVESFPGQPEAQLRALVRH
jgi:hypothetical protein